MLWLLLALAGAQDLVVKGEVVHTVSGEPITNGVVVVRAGKITAVGPAASIKLPADVRVIEGAVVTPGLVDGLSQVGLTGVFNAKSDQDHSEPGAIRAELRAIDGYNGWEELVTWVRERGVTTVQIGPSPGGLIAGRAAIMRTTAGAPDDVARVEDGMVVFTLGDAAKRGANAPTSRMGAASGIRQALAAAAEYQQRRKLGAADRPTVDLGMEALGELLDGKRKAVFVAHRADDLLTALRLADEHDLDMVLAGATEGYLVRDAIAEAGVPVMVGPVMTRSWGSDGERANFSYENASLLADVGIPVGFAGGYEGYVPKVRVVLWEAAIAAANRLGPERALEGLTLTNATILGIGDQVGSIEVGKAGDLVVYDGDPFEYASHVCAVAIDGKVVSETCR